jgi:hypothetical protein
MRIVPRVVEAKPTRGRRILVRFEDGLAAEVDFTFLLEPTGIYSRPLLDPRYFREVAIYPEGDTIHWPNEVDIDPEVLYERTRKAAGVAA